MSSYSTTVTLKVRGERKPRTIELLASDSTAVSENSFGQSLFKAIKQGLVGDFPWLQDCRLNKIEYGDGQGYYFTWAFVQADAGVQKFEGMGDDSNSATIGALQAAFNHFFGQHVAENK